MRLMKRGRILNKCALLFRNDGHRVGGRPFHFSQKSTPNTFAHNRVTASLVDWIVVSLLLMVGIDLSILDSYLNPYNVAQEA